MYSKIMLPRPDFASSIFTAPGECPLRCQVREGGIAHLEPLGSGRMESAIESSAKTRLSHVIATPLVKPIEELWFRFSASGRSTIHEPTACAGTVN